jgi:hypothetical protein
MARQSDEIAKLTTWTNQECTPLLANAEEEISSLKVQLEMAQNQNAET